MTNVKAYINLIRWKNSIATVAAVIVGALVAGVNIWVPAVFFACIVAFLIVAGGFAINDFYDRDIDAANNRDRPIPSGLIKPSDAKVFGYSLLTAGVILAVLTLNPFAIFIAGTGALVLDLYSRTLKRKHTLIGNLVTSYSTSIIYVFGAACILGVLSEKIILTLFWMVMITLLACLGREFVKSIQDIIGDAKFGVRTVAREYGIRTAAFLATILMIITIVVSPIPYISGLFGISYLALIITVDVSIFILCILLIRKTKELAPGKPLFDYAGKIKNRILYTMAIGILAFGTGLII